MKPLHIQIREAVEREKAKPPAERFQALIDRGAIDSKGRVLLRGSGCNESLCDISKDVEEFARRHGILYDLGVVLQSIREVFSLDHYPEALLHDDRITILIKDLVGLPRGWKNEIEPLLPAGCLVVVGKRYLAATDGTLLEARHDQEGAWRFSPIYDGAAPKQNLPMTAFGLNYILAKAKEPST